MKKLIPVILIAVVAAVAAYLLVFRDSGSSTITETSAGTTSSQENVTALPEADAAGSEKFTIAQVSEHNSASDCWTIINDNVYNLTSYIPRHPGGDEILRACGTDGTTLFETRTTNDGQTIGGGGSHSGSAEAALNELRIGSLED